MPLRPGLTRRDESPSGRGRLARHSSAFASRRSGGGGLLVAEIDIRPDLLAPNGFLHAATVVALADTACGYGCIAHLLRGRGEFHHGRASSATFWAPRATARSLASPRPCTSAGRRTCGTAMVARQADGKAHCSSAARRWCCGRSPRDSRLLPTARPPCRARRVDPSERSTLRNVLRRPRSDRFLASSSTSLRCEGRWTPALSDRPPTARRC